MNPSTDLDMMTAAPWTSRPAPARMVSLPTYAVAGLTQLAHQIAWRDR